VPGSPVKSPVQSPKSVPDQKRNSEEGKKELLAPAKTESAPASQPEKAPEPAPAAAWGGWGSFLSSAVSAVKESLAADVDSLVTTARDLGRSRYTTYIINASFISARLTLKISYHFLYVMKN
jgi:hypothetical protein